MGTVCRAMGEDMIRPWLAVFALFLGYVATARTFEEDFTEAKIKRQTPFKLCRNQLVGMLSLICSMRLDADQLAGYADFEDYLQAVLMRKKRSLSEDLSSTYRLLPKRSGLAIHCCTKSCTLQELRGFC